jgi:hypothetical protein
LPQLEHEHERAAPYEPTAKRGRTRQTARRGSSAQTDRRPAHTHTRPTDPTAVHIPTVHVLSPAPGPATAFRLAPSTTQRQLTVSTPNEESDAADQYMTEEDEDKLIRLALTWRGSRKLSLTLFHVDLAASFERWQKNQVVTDRKMEPAEAERRLQAIETRWRRSRAFRNSGSRLATNVERWMTTVREMEEEERTKFERRRRRLLKEDMPVDDIYGDIGQSGDEYDTSEKEEMKRDELLEGGVIMCRTCGHCDDGYSS